MSSDFYGDWLFYGGLAGTAGIGITIYFLAKKIGPDKVKGKHFAIVILLFMFPTVLLPLLLAPIFSITEKIAIAIGLTLFCIVRYNATTKGQEAVAELRELRKKKEEESEKDD
jgi:hypothetical protein